MGIYLRRVSNFSQYLEGYIVVIDNNLEGRALLDRTIEKFYQENGNRTARRFLHTKNEEWGWLYSNFLVDRKHVIRYGHGKDRGLLVGGVELAIGPHYFGPAAFWSYENSLRFSSEANVQNVMRNLALLDDFLGY